MNQLILMLIHHQILAMTRDEIPAHVKNTYRLLLLVCGMLLAVFCLTILAARILRRHRQAYLAERPKPTPNEDLWAQYRLPKDLEEDNPSEQSSGEK